MSKEKDLVTINKKKEEARVSSEVVALELGKDRLNTNELIEDNRQYFEQIGKLKARFRTESSGQQYKIYELNEDQAYLLLTFYRNNEKVKQAKVNLIKAFSNARKMIIRFASNQNNTYWLQTRQETKETRLLETNVIKKFVEYATKQGSKNAKFYYSNITKAEYKALFFIEQKYENIRDLLNHIQLSYLKVANGIVEKALKDGMNDNLSYKDIYRIIKKKLEFFGDMVGKSPILDLKRLN